MKRPNINLAIIFIAAILVVGIAFFMLPGEKTTTGMVYQNRPGEYQDDTPDPQPEPPCLPGTTRRCTWLSGCERVSTCSADKKWGPCKKTDIKCIDKGKCGDGTDRLWHETFTCSFGGGADKCNRKCEEHGMIGMGCTRLWSPWSGVTCTPKCMKKIDIPCSSGDTFCPPNYPYERDFQKC